MSSIHDLILRDGRQLARDLVGSSERRFVDVSAAAIAEKSERISRTHSALCWASFPRRQIANGLRWMSHGPRFSLIIEPGIRIIDGVGQPDGVPYGSRIRLIMLYVQTSAARSGTAEVPLCPTLNSCMQEMGLAVGGHSYDLVREQIRRFLACRVTLHDNIGTMSNGSRRLLIKDFNSVSGPSPGQATVVLGKEYAAALQADSVAVWQPALKLLANQSLSIDAYLWLAYLLPRLQRPTTASWATLHRQFGSSFKNLFQFKPRFSSAVKMAIAVYPNANVEFDGPIGLILRPSNPSVNEGNANATGCRLPQRLAWANADQIETGTGERLRLTR
jgi:hypothetical protein